MFAITFDLDDTILQSVYTNPSTGELAPQSRTNAWTLIARELEGRGFRRVQKSVYFGDELVTPEACVLAVQEITLLYAWFGPSVRDIRMLQIVIDNDLLPTVRFAMRWR